ncbi:MULTISPECIES: host-nuclease inhibitor Gam family protein [unclassified Bacillus (in: firmicutes)]|uniref:host-nuclease inhibitor Gam family protein n=1 Tax=unclassified Bacillus (in: firmicutes) TaxID=185979 RepID=UPI001BE792CA|nr:MULTISPECIES: host-nuclease inhibitor Gam family protein [unclassified Bacillus (in: firmicutes)]MBT2615299.1 host-nuclease inhibitor Gam family protein [Bacillus sp. ISL-78]MBT2628087.1 host-nuclease inhibitor Gam family protein [Bacillus sp. ISL-101]
MNSLQQIELMEVEEIQSQETNFEITDINSLNWAFRKLTALKSKEKEIKQLANVERDRIAEWEKGELSSITNSTSFFESLITLYHAKQLAEDPKAKTISTPYGKSKTRKSKETPDKADEEVILQYVIENEMDEFIKNSVKWADLKKSLKIVEISGEKVVVDENGQIVPGVIVKPESISYSVEV